MVAIIFFVLLIYSPSWWIRFTIWRYSKSLPEIPGSGAELATHLLKLLEIFDVSVEETTSGNDHYDPIAHAVRLSPIVFRGNSITAVAIAAHEVGHAIQFNRHEPSSQIILQYLPMATKIQQLGIRLITLPFFFMLLSLPGLSFLAIGLVILVMMSSAIVHLIILPQEWDASFNKALPILTQGNYLHRHHAHKVRALLRAAALTYFAAALRDILSFWHWGGILRGARL